MKLIFGLTFGLAAFSVGAQQSIYSQRFDQLSLQTYTTASSAAQYATLPAGFSAIDDGLANNAGTDTNPNSPFHVPQLNTSGWAVVFNSVENDTFLVSTSWLDTTGINCDRWAITPLMTNISANSVLTWLAKSPDANFRDGYEVYGTTQTGALNAGSFSAGDRLFALPDNNSNSGGENTAWTRRSISLASFAGMQLRFAFRNNSRDRYQLWIDDLELLNLTYSSDAAASALRQKKYILSGVADTVVMRITNQGAGNIGALSLSYQIGNSTVNTENFSFASTISYGQSSLVRFAIPYTVTQAGCYQMKAWINSVNGTADQNLVNDTLRYDVTVQNSAPAHAVLIEQFTSANSPTGVDAQARTMTLQDAGAIVVNIHDQDALSVPAASLLVADFKKTAGTALMDRYYFDDLGTAVLGRPYYTARFNQRKAAVVPVALSITNKNYNASTRQLSFTVKADFVGEVRGDYRIGAYLTENQVSGPQSDTTINGFNQLNGSYNVPWSYYYLTGYYSAQAGQYVLKADQFRHHNTLVHVFDTPYGNPGTIPSTGGTQGQSYQQTFTLTVPTATINQFHEENLYLVGFVMEYSADKNQRTVLNATKEKMTTASEVLGSVDLQYPIADVQLYPNPSAGRVELSGLPEITSCDIVLRDAFGRELWHGRSQEGKAQLDLRAYSDGLYFISIYSEGQQLTKKVLLSHTAR